MARLNKTLPQIKEVLSAADNGKSYKRLKQKSKLLTKYIEESSTLADEFNSWMKENHSTRYNLSHSMAKDEYIPTGKYCSRTGRKKFKKSGEKNKYSLFFFNWTQIERDIRQVMISCVEDGIFIHQVHDAIYVHRGEMQPSIEAMQKRIYNELGLAIKIE